AQAAAQTIIKGIENNAPRVLIGGDARFLDLLQRFLPGRYFSLLQRRIEKQRATQAMQGKESEEASERSLLAVVPAKAGTHNHRASLLEQAGAPASRNKAQRWLWVPDRRSLCSLVRDDSEHSRDSFFARVLQSRCPSSNRGRRESRALAAPVVPREKESTR